jgi:hypothetical protein
MITAVAARWLFTVVFAAAGLWAVLPRQVTFADAGSAARATAATGVAAAAVAARRVPAGFCVAMCAAMLVMTWRAEPAAARWTQAAVFGCAALGFGLAGVAGVAGVAGSGRSWRHALPHALMAVAMVWMFTAMPGASAMPAASAMPSDTRGAMMPMPQPATSVPVLIVSILLAVSCAATALWWLPRAAAANDSVSASHAAMSAGMAAMMLAML